MVPTGQEVDAIPLASYSTNRTATSGPASRIHVSRTACRRSLDFGTDSTPMNRKGAAASPPLAFPGGASCHACGSVAAIDVDIFAAASSVSDCCLRQEWPRRPFNASLISGLRCGSMQLMR